MTRFYALFKDDAAAERAVSKITDFDKDIKISYFDSTLSNAADDNFLSELKIIGSPSGMLANNAMRDSAPSSSAGAHPEFSPFCYADFYATHENSLASPIEHKEKLPPEGFEAGLSIKAPLSKKDAVMRILEEEGAGIV